MEERIKNLEATIEKLTQEVMTLKNRVNRQQKEAENLSKDKYIVLTDTLNEDDQYAIFVESGYLEIEKIQE